MAASDATSRRTEGPTPSGGAYAVAYFRDGGGNPTTEAKARSMEVVEYDEDDQVIARTYMEKGTGGAKAKGKGPAK